MSQHNETVERVARALFGAYNKELSLDDLPARWREEYVNWARVAIAAIEADAPKNAVDIWEG
jgi:hypothetical protein